ncbi:YbaK/EbsC family protein [Streptomyces sp. NPDC008265]|uniref:YbaK/EbsC family protein n=1 Tax=Streptomyces sp. NPDC008265 TaxID=3364824 RepID=UPI0036F1604D
MTTAAHPRFAEALTALGIDAEAIGCELGQIVKSLVFAADGVPVLVLMDGASRVDVAAVGRELGAARVTRADAAVVRETTGYAIGGVPPFGHRTRTRVLADRSLLVHDTVWAAAGTPHTVFPMAPEELVRHAGATVADVREQAPAAGA